MGFKESKVDDEGVFQVLKVCTSYLVISVNYPFEFIDFFSRQSRCVCSAFMQGSQLGISVMVVMSLYF